MARIIPSSYPGRAVIYVVTHLEILKLVLRYFVSEIIPIYWIFRSLTDAHHRKLFQQVLALRGVAPGSVSPLSASERAELQQLTQQHQTKAAARKNRADEHPALSWAVWLFTPQPSDCPALPARPFGAVKSSAFAADALSPYFELKGISDLEQAALHDAHVWSFRQFGGAALVLECIPILTLFLQFVTTVAAAMWAADLEKQGVSLTKREAPPAEEEANVYSNATKDEIEAD